MDAPTYPPAAAEYRQPAVVPQAISTQATAIADLLAIPAARAVLMEEIPGVQQRIGAGSLVPHLGNFSLRSLVQFGVFRAEQLDRVDARFRTLNLTQATLR